MIQITTKKITLILIFFNNKNSKNNKNNNNNSKNYLKIKLSSKRKKKR